jgi:hypothetical protein
VIGGRGDVSSLVDQAVPRLVPPSRFFAWFGGPRRRFSTLGFLLFVAGWDAPSVALYSALWRIAPVFRAAAVLAAVGRCASPWDTVCDVMPGATMIRFVKGRLIARSEEKPGVGALQVGFAIAPVLCVPDTRRFKATVPRSLDVDCGRPLFVICDFRRWRPSNKPPAPEVDSI